MYRGVGGCGELYPNVIWMFGIILALQHPLQFVIMFTWDVLHNILYI